MKLIQSLFLVAIFVLSVFNVSFAGRYYMPEIARWATPDPLLDKYPGWSPYNYVLNNPIKNIDPNGLEVYVTDEGYLYLDREIKDPNDPSVFLIQNNEQQLIGKLGGEISLNIILDNLLSKNVNIAENISAQTFVELVQSSGEWDLKNNFNTIFGLANITEGTSFRYDFLGVGLKPEDIGNFHFGVVGKATNIPLLNETILQLGAGLYQLKSGTSNPTNIQWIRTYFDDPRDNAFINLGFDYYKTKYNK